MSQADLAILLRLKDEASSGLDGVQSKLGGFGGFVAGGIAAAGAAIVAGVAVGVKAAGDLEQSVANVSTIKPDIDTSAIFASLNDMSTKIPATSAELGDSLYNVFSSMSVSSEQALGLVQTFAQGAVGAQTDAATFGTSIMGVLNAYGLAAEDATHVSDVFFNTVNAGVVTGQELASSLGPVTQAAKSAGVSVDELGGLIAGVTKEGGPAAQNINNLNNFLQKVTTTQAQTELKKLGVATTDATGAFRPTTDMLTDLKGKLEAMTPAARANAMQAIFPDAQARQGAATLLSQLDFVKESIDTNKTAAGSAASAYSTMSATFNSQSKLAMNGIMAILTTIGAQLLPVLTPMITAFAQSLPGAFQAAQAALGPVAASLRDALAPAFTAIMASLPTIISLVQSLFTAFSGTDVLDSAVEAMDSLFGPQITDMILSLTSLAGGAFRAVATAALDAFGGILAWFQANWPLIQQVIAVVLGAIATLWEEHGTNIVTIIQSAWTIVTTLLSTALANLGDLVRIAMQLITGDWRGAWDTLTGMISRNAEAWATILGAAWTGIVAIIDVGTGGALTKISTWMSASATAIADGWSQSETATSTSWDAITSAVGTAIDGVSSALDGAWSAIGGAMSSAWDGFTSTIQAALDGIQSAISTVWQAIPEDIRTDLELIATTLLERGQAWVENVTTTGTNMISAVATWLATLVSDVTTWATSTFLAPIQGLVGTATTEATNVGTGMLTSLEAQLSAIVTAVGTWVTSFLAPVTSLVGTATSAALEVGSGILTSITTKLGEVISAVTTWAGSVVSAISGLVGQVTGAAHEVGAAIVNGIVNGISSIGSRIGETLAGLARHALQSAKDALDIHSPSGAFREQVGKMIPAGLIEGIKDLAGPLDATLAGMVQVPSGIGRSVASSGSGPGGGSASGPLSLRLYLGNRELRDWYVETGEELDRQGRAPWQ